MIHQSIAERELDAYSETSLNIERLDPRTIQQAYTLDVIETTPTSSKRVSSNSALINPGEEDPSISWVALMIREILGKHSFS